MVGHFDADEPRIPQRVKEWLEPEEPHLEGLAYTAVEDEIGEELELTGVGSIDERPLAGELDDRIVAKGREVLGRRVVERVGHGQEEKSTWFEQREAPFDRCLDRRHDVLENVRADAEVDRVMKVRRDIAQVEHRLSVQVGVAIAELLGELLGKRSPVAEPDAHDVLANWKPRKREALAEELRREQMDDRSIANARATGVARLGLSLQSRSGHARRRATHVADELEVLVRSADARTLHSHSVPDVTEEFRSETIERAWWADRADIVLFGIVPWGSRWQRPHHFATELGRRGHRVVYVTPHFALGDERWRELDEESSQPDEVVLVQLATWAKDTIHGSGGWPADDLGHAHHTFWRLVDELRLRCPILFVESPAWWPLLSMIRERAEFSLVYDCLDEHTGWNEASAASLREWEEQLAAEADLVLASAPALQQRLQPLAKNVLLVPNGCDADHFAGAAQPTNALRPPLAGPIIGYFGAVSAGWFDTTLLVTVAELRPDWNFVLVGPADAETQAVLDASSNILQLGEVPYRDLPRYCADFDVATVPFLVNDLTKATDPVKLYEYFAAGKPVVTTPLPAVYGLQGPLAIADSPAAFEQAIESFLRDPGDRAKRQAIAMAADWARRADLFYGAMIDSLPTLDIVVLTHNGVELTRRCIASIRSDPSYEATLIVVDNASTDGTGALLDELEQDAGTIVLRNTSNEGFAAALNAGVHAGAGRYILLLNNDTELPRGGLLACAGGLARSREVGLLGPVTNSIGNEARIFIPYDRADEGALDEWFRRLAWQRFGTRFDFRVAALFAAILRREDFEKIGGIPGRYQIGMFEDDELSERIRGLGKRVVCAEDVFVHHAGAASFSTLDPLVYQAIFDRNKRVYERATGSAWEPQRYRPDRARPARDPDGIELT